MDSQFDDAVKAAREAKLTLAELESAREATQVTLQAKRQALAKTEEEAAAALKALDLDITNARGRLQRALQTINDAPVTAEAKAEAAEALPAEAEAEAAAEINVDGGAYINRARPFGSSFA